MNIQLFTRYKDFPEHFSQLEVVEFSCDNYYEIKNELYVIVLRQSSVLQIKSDFNFKRKFAYKCINYLFDKRDLFLMYSYDTGYTLCSFFFDVIDNHGNKWTVDFKENNRRIKSYERLKHKKVDNYF